MNIIIILYEHHHYPSIDNFKTKIEIKKNLISVAPFHFFKNLKKNFITRTDDSKLNIPKDLNSNCKTHINWYLDRHTTPHHHMVKNALEGMGKSFISGFTDLVTRHSKSNPKKATSVLDRSGPSFFAWFPTLIETI